MKKNILKTQLVTLFILTLFSFVSFYFGNDLPDNYFTITSNNSGNILSYYFFSLVKFGSYFSGPWILIPFFVFALCHTFIYDRREYMVDILNFFPLLFFAGSISFFLFQDALGIGLQYIFKNSFTSLWLGIYSGVAFGLFLLGTFRGGFKESIIKVFNFTKAAPKKVVQAKQSLIAPFEKKKPVAQIEHDNSLRKRMDSILKDDNKDKDETKKEGSLFASLNKIKPQNILKSKTVVEDKTDNIEQDDEDIEEAVIKPQIMRPSFDESNTVVRTAPDVEEEDPSEDVDSNTPREPQVKKVLVTAPLNRMADTSSDNQYFNIVDTATEATIEKVSNEPDKAYFEQIITLLESKLTEFKIEGEIVNVLKGPVVDTFEFRPGAGVKVSKIAGLADDLSLALYGAPIRVVPAMMGKDTVGVEVPRNPRDIIYLDEVLSSKEFQNAKYSLPIAMGKNAFGESFVIDLATCPHMLVAGATGAGKSVFINSLLVSLLVKKSPKKMKLILIDPKQLEMALYAKLPHLLMPVVTDAKTASIALLWACQEMDRRYGILAEFGVRNISGFNEKLKRATPEMLAKIHHHYEDTTAEDYELPYIVIIVDEFADLVLTKAGKEIENNIARIAAKARAAGIHLVLATQRPSVDVITGVIKSNFPTRVAFRVSSRTDSSTILDKIGAERLLGKGDMLYKHGINTQRVHSSYVDEVEIEALTQKLEALESGFDEKAMEFLENGGEVETDEYSYGSHITPASSSSSGDSLYDEAVKVVMESRSASASMLQRRLRIGYNRAANLIEELEKRGVVGPAQGAKPRRVLVDGSSPTL
ncbi:MULTISPECIES: DNA translocase FtsK [unclassified Halobacteriovorax]|uniref:DNA translocase FtsK n=1 Tax=unclassified Halobacteriovorax TaxID=2639665 RepID=UPI00399AB249